MLDWLCTILICVPKTENILCHFELFKAVISVLKGSLENSFQHCSEAWQDIEMHVYRERVNECNRIHKKLDVVYGFMVSV